MSTTEIERLLCELRKRPDLLAELRSLAGNLDRALEWVWEKGYAVTREDLEALAESDRKLSDEDLEQAAGGEDGWGSGSRETEVEGGTTQSRGGRRGKHGK